jgi:hypothetical protein
MGRLTNGASSNAGWPARPPARPLAATLGAVVGPLSDALAMSSTPSDSSGAPRDRVRSANTRPRHDTQRAVRFGSVRFGAVDLGSAWVGFSPCRSNSNERWLVQHGPHGRSARGQAGGRRGQGPGLGLCVESRVQRRLGASGRCVVGPCSTG